MSINNTESKELNQEDKEKKSFIIKIDHIKDFTTIDNKAIRDPNISFKSSGLLCFLLSLPANWKVNIKHLSKIKSENKDAITSALKELRDAGYVYIHQGRNQKGQMTEVQYFISEYPKNEEEFKKCLPQMENPLMDFPLTDNPPILNTNIYTKTNNTNMSEPDGSLASDDAHLCSKYLFKKVKESYPKAKDPNWNKWDKTFDKIIRMHKTNREKLIEIIDFIFRPKSLFVVRSPDSLYEKYENICFHMHKLENSSNLAVEVNSNNEENEQYKNILKKMHYLYKEKYFYRQDIYFQNVFLNLNEKYLYDEKRGKDWKTHATLKNFFYQLVNNKYVKITSFSQFLSEEFPDGYKYWKDYLTTNVYKQTTV